MCLKLQYSMGLLNRSKPDCIAEIFYNIAKEQSSVINFWSDSFSDFNIFTTINFSA